MSDDSAAAAAAGGANGDSGAAASAAAGTAASAASSAGAAGASQASGAGASATSAAKTDGAGAASGSGAGEAWGADWREGYAKGDEAKLNVLKRYTSPSAALDALFSAQEKIRSGQAKTALPENPTAEQLTAYRKDHGIPDKPEGYLEKLPDGMQLSDEERGIVTPYLGLMHKHNLPPAVAHEFIQARQAALDSMVEEQIAGDKTLRASTEEALRKEWGPEYQANINNIHSILEGAPEDVRDAFMNARTPDGSPLFGTLEAVQFFASLARQINPFGTIVAPGGGALDGKGVDERIAEIDRWMGASRGSADYNRYWKDAKVQNEYRTLLQARERNQKRAAA